ncbi:MAG: ArsR/SmtB family transcription factor [Chthoniobacterales bacterium]
MLNRTAKALAAPRLLRRHAPVFAALSDETRLTLVAKLSDGAPRSIARLGDGLEISRQAITKHLRVLESAGLVRAESAGRECLFELDAKPLEEARDYLSQVSRHWDAALDRLKNFVE